MRYYPKQCSAVMLCPREYRIPAASESLFPSALAAELVLKMLCLLLPCTVPAVVCAIAELLQLTSLHLLHGGMGPDVDLSHWRSLRSLAELKLLPGEEGGLNEQQASKLAATVVHSKTCCWPKREGPIAMDQSLSAAAV